MPITCRTLSGADAKAPRCYLLEVDEAKILLDCGSFTQGEQELTPDVQAQQDHYLIQLKEAAPTLSLVLLSNPQPESMGLLPFLIHHAQLPPTCQIYASPPTITLGRIALREWLVSLCDEFDPGFPSQQTSRPSEEVHAAAASKPASWKFTPVQLNSAMQRVSQIRYNAPVLLTGRNASLTLVAQRAGHTLGGTIWAIRTPTREEVTYAPVWNHIRERTLDPAGIIHQLSSARTTNQQRGIVLVGAERSKTVLPKSTQRSKALFDLVSDTLKSRHSILMPVDSSARVTELLLALDTHWTHAQLSPFPLCFVSRTAEELKLAFTYLWEYFSQQAIASGLASSSEGLNLRHVQFFSSPQELDAAYPPQTPKCVLSVPNSLSYGFSRQLCPSFAQQQGNVLILTGRSEPGTLADWFFQRWQNGQEGTGWGNDEGKIGSVVDLENDQIQLKLHHKIMLQGEELAAYEEQQRLEAEQKAKEKALQDRSRRLKEAAEVGDSDESSGEEDEGDADDRETAKAAINDAETGYSGGFLDEFLPESSQGPIDLYVRAAPRSEFTQGVLQPDGSYYFPSLREQTRARLFPFVERRRKVDAYGEVIDVQAWQSRGKTADTKAEETVLGKRKRDQPQERIEPPHKYTTETLQLQLRCSVFVVDMEGKADGRALKTLLPLMNPKKLVLIGAGEDSLGDLTAACKANSSMTQDIVSPALDETVQVGEDVKTFSFRLDDSFDARILSPVEDYRIGRLNGSISVADASSIPTLKPEVTQTSSSAVRRTARFLADFMDRKQDSTTEKGTEDVKPAVLKPLTPALFIGDVRLAVLRQRLHAQKFPAVFAGEGVLVCGPVNSKETAGGQVAVRKAKSGELILEGQPGDTYQLVRQTLYLLHAAAQ